MSFDHSFWFEGGSRNPYISHVISYTQIQPRVWEIVFDGYWYLEPETFPVKRNLKYSQGPSLFVDVLERTTIHEDPIEGTEEEPTLFPTSRIKIVYKVLSEVNTDQERQEMNNAIEGFIEEEQRNDPHRQARELRDIEAHREFCKTLDYSKATDFMKDA